LNSREYIESGILEEYVLGRLSAAERQDVEERAAQDDAIRTEIEAIELAFERYAVLQGVQPPAGNLNAVLEKIETTEATTTSDTTKNNFKNGFWIAVALFAAAAALAFYFFNQKQATDIANAELQQDLLETNIVCDSIQLNNDILQERLNFLRNANTRSTFMPGVENRNPDALAALHRNTQQQQAYLDVINLPDPPTDKRYQLWAIVDGSPFNMGVLEATLQQGSFLEVPYVENAQAYAITLEDVDDPEPDVPNLDELYVIGNVG